MAEIEMIEDTVRSIFAARCTPDAVRASEGDWMASLWAELEDLGFTEIGVRDEGDSITGSFSLASAMVGIGAAYSAPIPLAESIIATRVAHALGIAVPGGPASIATAGKELTATRDGDILTLEGTLRRVAWARSAKYVLVLSRPARVAMVVPIELCLVSPGTNLAAEPRDEVAISAKLGADTFRDLPDDWDGWEVERLGALMRTSQIAGALGSIQRQTIEYVGQRKQFGRRLAAFQAVQQSLAGLSGFASAAAAAARAAAETEGRSPLAAAAAKAYAGKAGTQGAAIAHQLHGAIGMTHEHQLHLSTRRIWSWREEFGSDVFWQLALGRELADLGAEAVWPALSEPLTKAAV